MALTLSDVMLMAYRDLGKIAQDDEFAVTSGSSATIVEDTTIENRESPYEANYGYGYTAFVVKDAGGASAAPEGEYSTVTYYDEGTYQWTIGALSAALATGDIVALANNEIPLRIMISQVNRMLKDLGRIDLVDASLTTADNQTEYALPLVAKYSLNKIQVQGYTGDANDNDNKYYTIYEKEVTPAAPGSTGLLTIPQFASGYTIKLWYDGVHSTLTAYNSPISETIDEDMAVKGLTYYALQWYNRSISGQNDFWYDQMMRAQAAYESRKLETPIQRVQNDPKFFSFGGSLTKNLPPDPVTPP